MSRILRELVGAREPAFSLRLRQLEAATGGRTIDVTLTGEVLTRLSEKTKQIGLDPRDTTNEELHAMLLQRASRDSDEIRRTYHGKVESMVAALNGKVPTTLVPVVKIATIRKLVGQNPPKKVMVAYGYRSIASLLKRGDIEQVIIACFLLESLTWHRAFVKKLRTVATRDITMQKPKAIVVDDQIREQLKQRSHPVYVQFAGLIGVLPARSDDGGMLVVATQTIEGLYHVHTRGVLLKLHRFDDDFSKVLTKYSYTTPGYCGAIQRIGLPWHAVYLSVCGQKHILAQLNEDLVEPADFFWRHPNDAVPLIHRGFEFWSGTDTIGRPTTYRPISLNISDIALDAYHLIPLSHSTHSSLSRSLTAELLSRYAVHDPKHETLLRNLGIIT